MNDGSSLLWMIRLRFVGARHCLCAMLLAASISGMATAQGTAGANPPASPAINGIVWSQAAQSKLNEAQQRYDAALARRDLRTAGQALNDIGTAHRMVLDWDGALENYRKALAIARQLRDHADEANALSNMASVDTLIGKTQDGIDNINEAIAEYSQLPPKEQRANYNNEAISYNNIARLYGQIGETRKAIDAYNKAFALFNQSNHRMGAALSLNGLGNIYRIMGDNQKALDYYNQSLAICQQEKNPAQQALEMNNIALVYDSTGETKKAIDQFNQALAISRQEKERRGEAAILQNIANIYIKLGEKQKALEYAREALTIFQEIGDPNGEAGALGVIGNIYRGQGELQKALDCFNQVLVLARRTGAKDREALALVLIASIYSELGAEQKAIEYLNQALPIYLYVGDRSGESAALAKLGYDYAILGEKQKALDFFNQALTLFKALGSRSGEAGTLAYMGTVDSALGKKQEALNEYNRALVIFRQIGIRGSEAAVLGEIGEVYDDLGQKEKALEYYNQALPLATAVNSPSQVASISYRLMLNRRSEQPSLAIYYGKQSVTYIQQVRQSIQGLDKDLQASFLTTKGLDQHATSDVYRDLADLLIAQNRLPEAQQVLDMLKTQEYAEFVRGGTATPTAVVPSLTPAERQGVDDYQKATAQLVTLGEQWSQLQKITSRTPEQEKQFQQLADQLSQASKGLNNYYSRMYELFGKNSDANKQVADVKGSTVLLKQQIARMPNTVALYTMLTKDRYSVIVITGSAMVAREYPIAEKDLNQMLDAFSATLRNPRQDPKPQAQELYKILIGPVKQDLEQAHAQTLVWVLDGKLRYIPMAALFDGKQYLVQSYDSVSITPVSIPHLADKPDLSRISVSAMGISMKYDDDLPQLPSVVGELNDIVKGPQGRGAHGVLPGTILLNGQFTQEAMENQLSAQHSVVHIASHFVFKPGDDNQSYLLLAGKDSDATGYHLTVADFRDDPKLSLDDTELLTLSACETGMSGNAGNGREVDGLGTTAQLKGAKAVISSLWEVDDRSTGELMADFYRRWANGGGKVMKVEALRQAQLDLLQGKPQTQTAAGTRGISPQTATASNGYSHPYYWAPFVLMGNWQ